MLSLLILFASASPMAAPYLAGIVVGFLSGAFGHLIKAPLLIMFGIVVTGITSALFVIAADPSVS
jgi:hypothetical protein